MLKVMLVDDMEIVRIELKRLKVWGEKTGFIIADEARNGEEALMKLEKNRIDLVITDIRMPKIDGMELLSRIVEKNLCPCVVLLSDFNEFSYARQGIVLGAFDFLAKPANEEELTKLLSRAAEHINSVKKETERVRKLEEIFEEKAEDFYQDDDIDKIVELIQSRDDKAADMIKHIIERIGANLEYDIMKVEGALKKAVPQVINSLLAENPWLEKFLDTAELNNFSAYQLQEFSEILEDVMENVQSIINIFNNYQLGYSEMGVVWMTSNYILMNIDNGVTLQSVAENLYMNRSYISEAFKQKTGISFIEYLTVLKMERAKLLIAGESLKSYEAAEKLGFKDVEYFGKLFKKYTGKTISEFRLKN